MKYPKIRELKEAVISLVTPAYTSSFPRKPHTPFENFRGKPEVDDKNCVGCETCANVCPSRAITIEDNRITGKRVITRDFGKCIFCGMCQQHCITGKGVILSDKIFDLAVFERDKIIEKQEKNLVVCKNCNAIITTDEHIQYMHNRLGPKAFASILNLNLLNEKLQLAPKEDTDLDIKDGLKRKDMFNIICPNCMRSVLIKYI
ncbi:MAG: 4Fe-4S dicluster domain-containing protein [Bacteroidales bacterium]|nr:4Fe-4S dicluster domain-containing protein [Bacteroidales bacterium]